MIFVKDAAQRQVAEASKRQLEESGRFDAPIVTTIENAQPFYEAEEEHQEFYRKNSERFAMEEAAGREGFVKSHWQ